MSPGVRLTSLSNYTTLRGAVAVLDCFLLFTPFFRLDFWYDFPYAHTVNISASIFASSLEIIPALERILILWKLGCPYCSWILNSLSCLCITVLTSGSYRCSLYHCMLKS